MNPSQLKALNPILPAMAPDYLILKTEKIPLWLYIFLFVTSIHLLFISFRPNKEGVRMFQQSGI